jgi:hypothetical protein
MWLGAWSPLGCVAVKPIIRRSAFPAASLAGLLAMAVTTPAGARDQDEQNRALASIVKTRRIAPGPLFTGSWNDRRLAARSS